MEVGEDFLPERPADMLVKIERALAIAFEIGQQDLDATLQHGWRFRDAEAFGFDVALVP
jgi:hypothetical protein